jgi:hypothetical protein
MTMTPGHDDRPRPGNIADPYQDLLSGLDEGVRLGFVQRLAVGYYEGWRPTRNELADLVARETGRITENEYLSLLRRSAAQSELRKIPPANDSRSVVPDRTVPPGPRNSRRTSSAAGIGRMPTMPTGMQSFTVDCGELAGSLRFIARGVFRDGWVRHADQRYQRISLHYELIPAPAAGGAPIEPVSFSAPITCVPVISAPTPAQDGRYAPDIVGARSIIGSRGPWSVSSETRQLRFLIYPQAAKGPHSPRHPAGLLRVDLKTGTADWRALASHRAEETGDSTGTRLSTRTASDSR